MKKILAIAILAILLFDTHLSTLAKVTVPADTDILLEPLETVTSKQEKDSIKLKVKKDVVIQNQVVFKEGSKAILKIVYNTPPSYMGVSGSLDLFNGYVYDANGHKHDVLINQTYKEKDRVWVQVLFACGFTIILAPLCLFGFVKGKDSNLSPANEIEVMLKEGFVF